MSTTVFERRNGRIRCGGATEAVYGVRTSGGRGCFRGEPCTLISNVSDAFEGLWDGFFGLIRCGGGLAGLPYICLTGDLSGEQITSGG